MRMASWVLPALVGVAADALGMEKTGSAWSELTGARHYRAKVYREPAIIKSVDGKDYDARVVKIAPGKRKVLVRSPYRRGPEGPDRELVMDVGLCKRYYINAQFKDAVTTAWEPVVAKVESIPGCRQPATSIPAR